MLDSYNREINYLRISITDKCNLRCSYCMPDDGVPPKQHSDFLSFEQIREVVKAAVKLGITKVRLTGGEPLVKKGITELVRMIREVPSLKELGMTTNGILLSKYAADLKRNGLDSLNISLDSLDPEKYRTITRIGSLEEALAGIETAKQEGFHIKINMVVFNDTEDSEIAAMRRFCDAKGFKLQLINHYSLKEEKLNSYQFDRPPKCSMCNRIRLMADGFLKPCLHTDEEIKLDLNNIEACLRQAILCKPERGLVCTSRSMVEIGG